MRRRASLVGPRPRDHSANVRPRSLGLALVMAPKPEKKAGPSSAAVKDGAPDPAASPAGLRGLLARIKIKWLIPVAMVAGLAIAWGAWRLLGGKPEAHSEYRLNVALRFLDDHRDQSARRIATALQDRGFQDPDFP